MRRFVMLRPAKHITLWLLFALMCTSCTGVHDIREARSTVAAADSLRAAGQAPYTLNRSNSSNLSNGSLPPDSTALAFAVTTLEPVRLLLPTDYAHANYYYGRLLREAGDHPEAMLAFLRAVHSRTRDHAIKGRSYSNIANMCRLAAEHELAYDIYKRSAEEFLRIPDSIAYYYALNNMAFDLAEDKQPHDAISLTNIIESEYPNENVLTKIWETRADAYVQAQKYDSAIYCVRQLHQRGYNEPTGLLLLAQAYEGLNIIDSALLYAKKVYDESSFYGDKFNALFILSHYDSTLTPEEILSISSEREDIRFYQHEPAKKKLTQAVLLLNLDLERKPNLTWLWVILMTILVVTISLSIYIQKQKSKRKLLSQQTYVLEHKKDVLFEQLEQIQVKFDSLSAQTRHMELQQSIRSNRIIAEIELYCDSLNIDTFRDELCWGDYNQMCTIVNKRMFNLIDKLIARGLTYDKEIQLCVLVVINKFSDKQMANILLYGDNSIRTIKRNVAKSLGTSSKNLRKHLLEIVVLN